MPVWIVRESNRLSKLTSNILRLSKLSNDKIHLNRRSFSLDEQIRQIILLLEPKWSKKHLRFQLHLPHTIYMGDEELLSEIWLNLLDNAVKYSPETGLIDISLIETQYTYQIYLRDQGPGIDKDTIITYLNSSIRGYLPQKRRCRTGVVHCPKDC